jgi:hypothetical protein
VKAVDGGRPTKEPGTYLVDIDESLIVAWHTIVKKVLIVFAEVKGVRRISWRIYNACGHFG